MIRLHMKLQISFSWELFATFLKNCLFRISVLDWFLPGIWFPSIQETHASPCAFLSHFHLTKFFHTFHIQNRVDFHARSFHGISTSPRCRTPLSRSCTYEARQIYVCVLLLRAFRALALFWILPCIRCIWKCLRDVAYGTRRSAWNRRSGGIRRISSHLFCILARRSSRLWIYRVQLDPSLRLGESSRYGSSSSSPS